MAFVKPWKCWCISSQWLYLPRYACLSINTTGKKLPSLDFNAAEVSVFRIAFDVFYDAVVGSTARVPGQHTQFGKRFLALMESTGLANIDSCLNHKLDQRTTFGHCHELALRLALSELRLSCEWIGGAHAHSCTLCIGNQYATVTVCQDQAKCCDGTMAIKETFDDIMQFKKVVKIWRVDKVMTYSNVVMPWNLEQCSSQISLAAFSWNTKKLQAIPAKSRELLGPSLEHVSLLHSAVTQKIQWLWRYAR